MKHICFVDQTAPPIAMIHCLDINVPQFAIEDASAKMDTEDKPLPIVAFRLKNAANMSLTPGCKATEGINLNLNLHLNFFFQYIF